jgi:ubiquinone/menaquinone biosynthesis C-methylase UbiE
MITQLIPKPVKDWLKGEIQRVAFNQYIPYLYKNDSFLLPKSPTPARKTCSSGMAIPPKRLWLGYGETEEDHLASGLRNTNKMLELLQASGFSLEGSDRVLDFGCGAGRMIRHLKAFSESCEIWGTDISAPHIFWAKQYLDPPFHFVTTTTVPHLPFEDRYFNLIYCGSVFTHIDDLAEAWLLELRRILAPQGRLYLTIHDRHTIELLDGEFGNSWLAKTMKTYELYNQAKDSLGMLVIGRQIDSQVFYDLEYFSKMLNSMMFNVLSIAEEAYGLQTAVLVKRA